MKIDDGELRGLLINPLLNKRGQYMCDCLFCGKPSHMYVNKDTQLFDCKKCGEVGNIYKLLNFLDKLYLLKDGETIENRDLITSILDNQENIESITIEELPNVKMPVGWKVFNENEYLQNRGLTKKQIKHYKLGGTILLNKFKGYVLMPVFEGGCIKGYVGRYGAKKVPKEVKRYKNSEGFPSADLLYGIDEVIAGITHTVILVEGIFDKISVDKFLELNDSDEIKCNCTFGKKISDVQIRKLYKKKVKNIVLLYDFDAIREIKKYGLELEKYFFTTITFTLKKDIDECTLDEALEVFSNTMSPKEFNFNVIGKIKS